MLLHPVRVFFRRSRRLALVTAIVLLETLYLNLTVRRTPPERRLRYRADRQSVACRRALKVWGIEVRTRGDINPDQTCLIASNHLGIADVFLISSAFPVTTSGKAELLRTPVVRWVCKSIAMIPVYRDRRLLSADFADNVATRLDAGVNVLVFPEGTTAPGTTILPFKTGGFAAVERKAGRVVLPIALIVSKVDGHPADSRTQSWFTWADSRQSLFGHFWRLLGIESAVIEIGIGSVVDAEGLGRKELADACHSEVSGMCKLQVLPADTSV